jgi:predicted house-cleaning noncanonical NTP pyrophosphatase (MazG superfamily)
MRDEINEFAEKMEDVTAHHDAKKGSSWKTCHPEFLIEKLKEEVGEYMLSKNKKELIDIANICWMLYHNKGTFMTPKERFMKQKIPEWLESIGEEHRKGFQTGAENGYRVGHTDGYEEGLRDAKKKRGG